MGLGQRRGCRVELFQFAKEPGQFGQAGEQRIVGIGESPGDLRGKLDEAAAVRGDMVAGNEFVLFVLAQGCGFDLVHLVTQKVEFAFQ